jgi:hypothetical protein
MKKPVLILIALYFLILGMALNEYRLEVSRNLWLGEFKSTQMINDYLLKKDCGLELIQQLRAQ